MILKSIVIGKKKAPKFAKKVVKSLALSSAAEVLFHHKTPDGSLVLDVTFIEGVETVVKCLSHHL